MYVSICDFITNILANFSFSLFLSLFKDNRKGIKTLLIIRILFDKFIITFPFDCLEKTTSVLFFSLKS